METEGFSNYTDFKRFLHFLWFEHSAAGNPRIFGTQWNKLKCSRHLETCPALIIYYYYYFIQIPMIKLEINQTPAFVHVPSPCHCPSPFLILLICVNASICMPGWSFPNHYSTCSLIPSATWIAVEEDKTHTHTHPCSQPQRLRYACVPRPNLVRRQQHEPRP